jgi:hypothetical protein
MLQSLGAEIIYCHERARRSCDKADRAINDELRLSSWPPKAGGSLWPSATSGSTNCHERSTSSSAAEKLAPSLGYFENSGADLILMT